MIVLKSFFKECLSKANKFCNPIPRAKREFAVTHYHRGHSRVGKLCLWVRMPELGFRASENVTGTHHSLPKDLHRAPWAALGLGLFCPLVCLVERAVKCGRAGTLISQQSSGEAVMDPPVPGHTGVGWLLPHSRASHSDGALPSSTLGEPSSMPPGRRGRGDSPHLLLSSSVLKNFLAGGS